MHNHYHSYNSHSKKPSSPVRLPRRSKLLRSFLQHSSGAAATEYAILLALVIGVVVTAGHLLGGATHDTFSRVFAKAAVTSGMPHSKPDSTNASSTTETLPRAAHATRFQLLTTQFIAIVSLGGLLIVLRRARKRRELLGDDTEVPKTVRQLAVQNRLFKKRQLIYKLSRARSVCDSCKPNGSPARHE